MIKKFFDIKETAGQVSAGVTALTVVVVAIYSSYSFSMGFLDNRYIEPTELDNQIAMQAQQFEQVIIDTGQKKQLKDFNNEIEMLRAKERFGEATETDKWQLQRQIDKRGQLIREMK